MSTETFWILKNIKYKGLRIAMIKNIFGNTSLKVNWQGEILSIQPRTRVWRYLTDNRTHYHLGYNLFVLGYSSDGKKQFSVALSEKQQLKGLFRIGDVIEGTTWTKKYEERGAKLLSKSLWKTKCFKCIWANMANAEIQWDFDKNIKKYRFETFCYGPKSCKFYKMGTPRSVPYKNSGAALDDGALDEICTEGREKDD